MGTGGDGPRRLGGARGRRGEGRGGWAVRTGAEDGREFGSERGHGGGRGRRRSTALPSWVRSARRPGKVRQGVPFPVAPGEGKERPRGGRRGKKNLNLSQFDAVNVFSDGNGTEGMEN